MCNVGVLVPAINLGGRIPWGNVWRSNHRRALRILNSTGLHQGWLLERNSPMHDVLLALAFVGMIVAPAIVGVGLTYTPKNILHK